MKLESEFVVEKVKLRLSFLATLLTFSEMFFTYGIVKNCLLFLLRSSLRCCFIPDVERYLILLLMVKKINWNR